MSRAGLVVVLLLVAGCCAGPVNPSFRVSRADARAATAAMRKDPRPLSRPLVVIGGFIDLNFYRGIITRHLKAVTSDRRIIAVPIAQCRSFDECRRMVIDAVDRAFPATDPVFTTEVDVVGASLGGLAARLAAAPSRDASQPRRLKIARLFSISSPHLGAVMAQRIALNGYHRDMKPDSPFMHWLSRFDATATYELVPYTVLRDEWVGEHNAAPAGITPWWVSVSPLAISPHGAALCDPRILADIARRLRNEPPLTTSPAAPLPAVR